MDKFLEEYRDLFDEPFPLMLTMGMDDSEIIKIIKASIESGEPYDPEINDGTVV